MTANTTELARAKLNLTLHVTGQRADGFHLLDSLVVFPDVGDTVYVAQAHEPTLQITGAFADQLVGDRNLVLDAMSLMGVSGAVQLSKDLPVAAGLGGGSADAAATLRALAKIYAVGLPDITTMAQLGADIPVCVAQQSCRMRGIGEQISAVDGLPPFWLVIANCRLPVATAAVFKHLQNRDNPAMPDHLHHRTFDDLIALLRQSRNDLEAPAIEICPTISIVLDALAALPGCALSRMSGSGGTCFGIFAEQSAAHDAAARLQQLHPAWWVRAAAV